MDLQDDQLIRLLADFKEHLSADIQNDLKVPSIVVLGAENNGKSSLLSRIIGMNILPVGNGVCTKCPIEVTVLHNPSLVGKFKLSIGYEKQERLRNETKPRSIKIEQCSLGSEAWKEYDNHEEMRDEVTKIVEAINKRRKQTGETLYGSEFSSESIKILVESNEFSVNLSFTDVPGYNNSERKNNALNEIYSKTMTNDSHSIVLWVHQATNTMGGGSVNDELVRQMLGERWRNRVVGVLTKIDEGVNAVGIAESIMNGTEGLGLRWFGVINKSNDEEDTFSAIENYETKKLHELLNSVDDKKLGIQQLRKYLADELIAKMKDLLRGDKFRKTINESLAEVNKLLDNEPHFTPFATSGYFSYIGKVSSQIKGELFKQSEFAASLKENSEKFSTTILNQVILPKQFSEYYQLVAINAKQSGGLEKSVGVSNDLPREFLVEPRMKLHKDTMAFLQDQYKLSMDLLTKNVEEKTSVGKEENEFKSFFLARLRPDEPDSSYATRFENVKNIVESLFNASEHMTFPGSDNLINTRYSLYTTRAYRMIYEKIDQNSADFKEFGNDFQYLSRDQKAYGNKIADMGKAITNEPLKTKQQFAAVMDIVIGQISTLAYLLTEMVPALLNRMLLEGTDNLAETFNTHKTTLGVYYDREKRQQYDFYHAQKPHWERKKNGLMELKKKYPDIL